MTLIIKSCISTVVTLSFVCSTKGQYPLDSIAAVGHQRQKNTFRKCSFRHRQQVAQLTQTDYAMHSSLLFSGCYVSLSQKYHYKSTSIPYSHGLSYICTADLSIKFGFIQKDKSVFSCNPSENLWEEHACFKLTGTNTVDIVAYHL